MAGRKNNRSYSLTSLREGENIPYRRRRNSEEHVPAVNTFGWSIKDIAMDLCGSITINKIRIFVIIIVRSEGNETKYKHKICIKHIWCP